MTLSDAKMNFGRQAVFMSADGTVTETGEIRGIWYEFVQLEIGNGVLRFVSPSLLELVR